MGHAASPSVSLGPDSGRWVLILGLLVSPVAGFGTRFPWSLLPFGLGRVLWTLVTLVFLLLFFLPRARAALAERIRPLLRESVWIRALLIAAAGMLLLNYGYFRGFGYQIPWLGLMVCAVSALLVPRWPVAGTVIASAALLAASIHSFPLMVERSDMLPVTELAMEHWQRGDDPYGRLPVTAGTPHMPYLPAMFFSHLPAWLAGIDLRWNSVFYRLIWGCLIARPMLRLPAGSPLRICAIFLLLNPYLVFRHDLYFEFSLLLTAAFWMLPRARWAILALAMLTRQWAWVLAPFLIIGTTSRSLRNRLGATAHVFAWLLVWGAGFWVLLRRTTSLDSLGIVVGKFQALIGADAYLGDYGFTLQPLLRAAGAQSATQLLQAIAVTVLLVLALRVSPARAMWLGFAALAIVLSLNVLYWNYFALELALWMLGWELWRGRQPPGGESHVNARADAWPR